MNFLFLGVGYTGRYAFFNFNKEYDFYFLSRRNTIYKDLSYFEETPVKPKIDCIVNCIPPAGGIPYQKIINDVLEENENCVYIYISSTAVFPKSTKESNISVYNENSPVKLNDKKGKLRFLTEEKIKALYPKACILRSTGIYGKGRSLVEQILSKNFSRTSIGNPFVSRIHVHDLCRLLFALGQKDLKSLPSLVHAVDKKVACYYEIFSFLEKILDFKIPGNWRESKKSGRIIQSLYAEKLLEGRYSFPSYKEGFSDILKNLKL